jgi:hypothetical protein
MIIFGSRGVTWSGESGQFACPGCGGSQQTYVRKTVRRFFTLYFIPIIPLDKLGEYIECQRCRNKYNDQVLSIDPAADAAKRRADFVGHLAQVMTLAALQDGQVDDAEREAIREQYKRFAGTELSYANLEKEFALARQAGITLEDYVRWFAGDLNAHGKELVIGAVHAVLSAGRGGARDHLDLMKTLATAMSLSPAHFNGIVAELGKPQGPDHSGIELLPGP